MLFLLPVATMFAAISVRAPEAAALTSARCRGLVPTIVGTAADDVLLGTAGPDVIIGFGGDDIIRGRGGNDVLCGSAGSDVIFGGPGNDWISGSAGYDILKGGDGHDTLSDLSASCRGEVLTGCTRPAPPPPPPPPPPPAPPAPTIPSCEQAPDWVVAAIYASFSDTPHVCHFADYISWRESRWTAGIIGGPNPNGTYDYGLLQLNSQYIRTWAGWAGVDWNDWDDPMINAQIARALYDRAGQIWGDPLRPWNAR